MALHLVEASVRADRRAGYPSRSVVAATSPARFGLVRAADFDVVWESVGVPHADQPWAGLRDLLRHGDIWVTFFDGLFFSAGQRRANAFALWLLGVAGVRIVAVPHGMDVFYRSARVTRFDWVGRAQRDYPDWDLTAHASLANQRIELYCRRAALVVSSDSTTTRFLPRRDLLFKWFPADLARPAAIPERVRRPIVVHAPQHRFIKGTDHLLTAAARLQERGFDFELRLVERVPRVEALQLYADADIVAEQFCMGAYGMLALEGLALGKPVLAYLDQEHLGDPAFDLPLVNTNPENLERVLAALVSLPELRSRLGRAGRAAAERYQSEEALGEVWDRIYRHVWWGAELSMEGTRHFSAERRPRSFSEDPADPAFWPVPVDDLLPAIRAAAALSPHPIAPGIEEA